MLHAEKSMTDIAIFFFFSINDYLKFVTLW